MTSNPPQRNYEILTSHKKALAYSRTTNVELKIYASAAIIYNVSSACFKSSTKSSVSSIPTEILTSPSVIPSLARISAGMDACVISAGTEIKLSTAPKLSANV